VEKIRYSKYKSVEITKALKEPKQETSPVINPMDSQEMNARTSPVINQMASPVVNEVTSTNSLPIANDPSAPDLDDYPEFDENAALSIQKASKHTKFANSALLYSDVRTAIVNLENALAILKTLE
jgi:hypothetical protein